LKDFIKFYLTEVLNLCQRQEHWKCDLKNRMDLSYKNTVIAKCRLEEGDSHDEGTVEELVYDSSKLFDTINQFLEFPSDEALDSLIFFAHRTDFCESIIDFYSDFPVLKAALGLLNGIEFNPRVLKLMELISNIPRGIRALHQEKLIEQIEMVVTPNIKLPIELKTDYGLKSLVKINNQKEENITTVKYSEDEEEEAKNFHQMIVSDFPDKLVMIYDFLGKFLLRARDNNIIIVYSRKLLETVFLSITCGNDSLIEDAMSFMCSLMETDHTYKRIFIMMDAMEYIVPFFLDNGIHFQASVRVLAALNREYYRDIPLLPPQWLDIVLSNLELADDDTRIDLFRLVDKVIESIGAKLTLPNEALLKIIELEANSSFNVRIAAITPVIHYLSSRDKDLDCLEFLESMESFDLFCPYLEVNNLLLNKEILDAIIRVNRFSRDFSRGVPKTFLILDNSPNILDYCEENMDRGHIQLQEYCAFIITEHQGNTYHYNEYMSK